MKKRLGQLLSAAGIVALAACGGGGGGGGGCNQNCTIEYSHAELADIFVERLWTDAGIDAELVKTYTREFDYIVVYDWDLDTYDAYWIGNYDVGDNILDYLDDYDHLFYYDLDVVGDNLYQDWLTGLLFEKTRNSSKDRLKVAALRENEVKQMGGANIAAAYGLSQEQGERFMEFVLQIKNTPKHRMTDRDYDAYATEMFGASITDIKSAANKHMQGESKELKDLVLGTIGPHLGKKDAVETDEIFQDVFGISVLN